MGEIHKSKVNTHLLHMSSFQATFIIATLSSKSFLGDLEGTQSQTQGEYNFSLLYF